METIKAYVALTKPRVIELLLVATFPAMLQAERGVNHIGLILLTVIGGWMGAAAANTFNMVADSDIDKVMKRTERRPLAKMVVSNRNATIFAWTLTVTSFLWLWLLCHSLLAAVFVMLTIAFYIFVYTKWLKRSTPMNIVWGGAAGCMPTLVGWAVIADNLPEGANPHWWQAVVLFMVIFFWTPPHTWALAMRYKEDYAAAGVPMMPVVRTEVEVTRQIVGYTWATVLTTLLLVPAAGWLYAVVAVLTGIWFLIMAIRLHAGVKKGEEVKPLKLFILSNNYLAIVFVALSLDAILGLETIASWLGWTSSLFI
ncbi:protoheme IX farnesyltransferase [Corynebacterium sp. 13CS0277]|uniref:heme o synthase n=1 Tax=Corynebacterium sp. 13CS0277 TaxID=2071994 RepID=UPI000D040A8B|nr:heme o synthase [Corynebacterium sp. 13CS0277]PRQ11913.1 protoheme IX farnesyltransferase [Corynebacterium sp. 13CS0277]